jgi:hypothetical protein
MAHNYRRDVNINVNKGKKPVETRPLQAIKTGLALNPTRATKGMPKDCPLLAISRGVTLWQKFGGYQTLNRASMHTFQPGTGWPRWGATL